MQKQAYLSLEQSWCIDCGRCVGAVRLSGEPGWLRGWGRGVLERREEFTAAVGTGSLLSSVVSPCFWKVITGREPDADVGCRVFWDEDWAK